MNSAKADYVALKADFESLIDQCHALNLEKEKKFQAYRNRIHQELQTLSKDRELFDERCEKNLRDQNSTPVHILVLSI